MAAKLALAPLYLITRGGIYVSRISSSIEAVSRSPRGASAENAIAVIISPISAALRVKLMAAIAAAMLKAREMRLSRIRSIRRRRRHDGEVVRHRTRRRRFIAGLILRGIN